MKYVLNTAQFKQSLHSQGYKSLFQFAQKNKIHRNTLLGLLAGKEVFLASYQLVADALGVDPVALVVPVSSLDPKIQNSAEIAPIVAWLVKQNPQIAVVLIGSRARGKAKQYSDWDLGVVSFPEPISSQVFLKYKNEVEDMSENIVRMVDLINLNQAPVWFLENIAKEVVFLDGNYESFIYLKGVLNGATKQETQTSAGAP